MDSTINFVVLRSTPANKPIGWFLLAFCAALIALPWWGDASLMRWVVEVICFLVLAQMWNLMAGYGGLISVGQQAFVGLGGYGLFVLAQHWRVNPFLAVPLAGIAAALLAVPLSKLVFRLRGGYFAVGTWVVSAVCRILVSNVPLVGGGSGQSLTVMASIQRDVRESTTYWMACALLIGMMSLVYGLLRSRFGLGLTAIRDSEAAAESQGVRVATLKFQVYVLSAFGTAMVGALYYLNVLRIAPASAFDLGWVVAAIFMVVIGGIGTLEGPIVGAAVFFLLRWLLSDYGSWYWLVMGVVAIVVMVFFPKGLWGSIQQRWGVQVFPLQRRLKLHDSPSIPHTSNH